jgi:hypothetical protein
LGNTNGVSNLVSCTLLENFNPLAAVRPTFNVHRVRADDYADRGYDGGIIKLSCNSTTGGQTRSSVITAIRVGAHTRSSPRS